MIGGNVMMKNPFNNNMGTVVIVVLMIIIVVYVMVYVYKQYNSTSLQTVTMLKKPTKVPSSSLKNVSKSTALPTNVNGKEFTYSFWMYIDAEDIENTANHKLVMCRMTSSTTLGTASPVFMLDKSVNKLYVYTKQVGASSEFLNVNTIHDSSSTLTIPYIPLQRWVNIMLVVDNNFIQLFMDGELREVKDLSRYEQYEDRASVVATPVGDIVVGSLNQIPSFNGYVSKVQVFNYALTLDHAKVIYKAGPLHKSILSVIGVPYYGIQSPFYRIDDDLNENKENCTA